MKWYQKIGGLGLSVLLLTSCVTTEVIENAPAMEEIEAFAICDSSTLGQTIESKIRAEYGFKRFAQNAYRPVVQQRLFGHEVRIVEISEESNKIYASGEPLEFAYVFKYLLSDIICEEDTCQAPLENGESLLIYKTKLKKAKDTTVIECTKPLSPETE